MIATVTFNPAVDQTVRLDGDLEPGTVMRTDDQRFDAAGKGMNVSKYLVALDAPTVATGPVGGFTGALFPEQLEAAGVDHDLVPVDGTTRLNTNLTTPGAEYKINQAGPEMDDTVVDAVTDRLTAHDPRTVVVGGSLPPGLDPTHIDRLADGPWDTVVDVEGNILAALQGSYRLCKPNRDELAAATGMPVGSREEVVAAARALRDDGFDTVIASLGADGAVLVTGTVALHAAALDVPVTDTVGAGDAVLAGFIAARHAGDPVDAALRQAMAMAARVVATSGTRTPEMNGFADDAAAVELTEI